MKQPSILVLGTADWNQPIATNQHYVVRELCRDGFADVSFVESMALRAPRLNRRDLERIATRLSNEKPSSSPTRQRPEDLKVISPLTLPWHRGAAKPINRSLLARITKSWQGSASPRVLWTYTPVTYGLEKLADLTIYHCVDLLGEVPGIDPRVIATNEKRLAAHGAHAVATSRIVQAHLKDTGFDAVTLWENVADTEIFAAARKKGEARKPGRAIFAGNLTPSKIDYELLLHLRAQGLDIILAGPRAEGGDQDEDEFARLAAAGVHHVGMLSLEELATELTRAAVGLIPYAMNDYTRGVSPLKTFEYAAAGLPIVSTSIPGVHAEEDEVWVEPDHASFAATATGLAHNFSEERAQRLAKRAETHSWTRRGRTIREYLTNLLAVDGHA